MKILSTFSLLTLTTFACSQAPKEQASIKQNVSVEIFEKMLAEGNVQLIDVRTLNEFNNGYIANAQLIDFTQSGQFEIAISKLDKERPVMVYCAVGGRSSKAANILQQKGFKQIYDLTGGFNEWKTANKPYIKAN